MWRSVNMPRPGSGVRSGYPHAPQALTPCCRTATCRRPPATWEMACSQWRPQPERLALPRRATPEAAPPLALGGPIAGDAGSLSSTIWPSGPPPKPSAGVLRRPSPHRVQVVRLASGETPPSPCGAAAAQSVRAGSPPGPRWGRVRQPAWGGPRWGRVRQPAWGAAGGRLPPSQLGGGAAGSPGRLAAAAGAERARRGGPRATTERLSAVSGGASNCQRGCQLPKGAMQT